jgi:hypothetical protein
LSVARLLVATSVLATGLALSAPAIAGSDSATHSGSRDVCHEHFGADDDPTADGSIPS